MRSRSSIYLVGVVLFLLSLACSGGASSSTTSSGAVDQTSTETHPAETADDFPYPPNPSSVQVTLDAEHSFNNRLTAYSGLAMMSQIGGPLAEGWDFTVQLPGGMVTRNEDDEQVPAFGTLVTVTPVSAIEGLPFAKGYLAAVQLEPAGLQMIETASLSFSIESDFPENELVGFAADDDGGNFHLFPIRAFSGYGMTNVFVNINHFSIYGVAQATLQEIEAQHAHPPTKAESQMEDELAPLVPVDDDLAPLPTESQLKLGKEHSRLVKPQISRLANMNCNQVANAAYAFEAWQGRVDLADQNEYFRDQINQDAGALAERLEQCLKQTCPACIRGEAAKKSVDSFLVLTSWAESINRILGDDGKAAYWRELGNQCAIKAGLPPPEAGIADGGCIGNGCDATPTPVSCP